MAFSHSPKAITDGLIFAIDAANIKSYTNGSSAWTNVITGGTGSLTNGPTFSTSNGGTLVFDGTNDYVTFGNIGTVGNFQTIDIWFYSTSVTNYKNMYDMNLLVYPSENVGPRMEQNSGGTFGVAWSGNTGSPGAANGFDWGAISANTWYNAVWTNNNGTVNVYVNGVARVTNQSSPNGFITTFGNVVVGFGAKYSDRYFQGNIPLFRIYNRALSATEVQQNFNAHRRRFGV